jgi:hypothetical protein
VSGHPLQCHTLAQCIPDAYNTNHPHLTKPSHTLRHTQVNTMQLLYTITPRRITPRPPKSPCRRALIRPASQHDLFQCCTHNPKTPHHPTTHTDHSITTMSLTTQLSSKPFHLEYSTLWPSPTMLHTRPTHSRHIQHKPSTSDSTVTYTNTDTSQHYETGFTHNSPADHSQTPQIAL